MSAERLGYKQHPLWQEAMALAREAYAVAEDLRGVDPEGALRLRKAAVAAAAHVAGALSAEDSLARETDASAAREAAGDVAACAGRPPERSARTRELLRRAHELERSIGQQFTTGSGFAC